MMKKCPQRKSSGSWKKEHTPWNKGLTKETDERVKEVGKIIKINALHNKNFGNRNKKLTNEHKTKISETNKGNMNGINAYKIAWERILQEAEELKKQGFRVIPITKVIPDIIAIKDNKIFAVEVEYSKPNYNKYTDEIRKFYDDIIWIIRKRGGRN